MGINYTDFLQKDPQDLFRLMKSTSYKTAAQNRAPDTLQPHPYPAPLLRTHQSRKVTASVSTHFNWIAKLTDTPVEVIVPTIKLPIFCLP